MWESIGTITAVCLGIGGVVVSLTTQLNHVAHLKADQEKQQKAIDDLYVKFQTISDAVSKINTETAENHAELKGMFDNIKDLCAERHKQK